MESQRDFIKALIKKREENTGSGSCFLEEKERQIEEKIKNF
jgi:hypothetical protein